MKSFTRADVDKELEKRKTARKNPPVFKKIKRISKPLFDQVEVSEKVKQEVDEQFDKIDLIHELQQEASEVFKNRARLSSSIYKAVTGRAAISPIDIGSVLQKIDQYLDDFDQVKTFGIRYLKAPGIEGEMTDCRKNVKDPKRARTGKVDKRAKSQFSLKERGIIRMHNEEKGYRDITVACIYQFKDHKSSRWIAVRH